MKFIIVFALVIAAALARPADEDKDATIVKYDNDNIGVGAYNYAFETSNGHSAQETAELKNVGTEDEALSVRGSYSYIGPDGVTYTVNYVADELGFRPEGAHIPVADA